MLRKVPFQFLFFLALTALGSWVLLAAAYSLRGEFRLGVGELGSGPYLSGFQGDEAGAPRYRWTGNARINLAQNEAAVGTVTLPLALNPGESNLLRVSLRGAPDPGVPIVRLSVNGIAVGETRAGTGGFKTADFAIPPAALNNADITRVEISSPAFKPSGDSRILGVQVAEVKIITSPGFRRPPLEAALWAWLYCAAAGLILLKLVRSEREAITWSAGAGCATLIPWLLLPMALPSSLVLWYTPFYLPLLGGFAGLAALLAWIKEASAGLNAFFERLETRSTLARNLLLVAVLAYALYGFAIIVQMDFIGHADYADNAVAARNIVQGKGYSLDYAAQFYQRYTLPRPADTWPPLQPFLTVPFFLVFGPTTWAAKLPNLLLVVGLAWAVFFYGSRRFNRRTGLGAALFSLLAIVPAFSTSPAFFETVAYPINDLGFTLLAFLALNAFVDLGYARLRYAGEGAAVAANPARQVQAVAAGEINPANPVALEEPESNQGPAASEEANTGKPGFIEWLLPQAGRKELLLAGLWSGLLFLSKPSGAILLVAGAGWLLWRKYGSRPRPVLPWKALLLAALIALLVISPYLVRNVLQFGSPYRSTEQYDTWVTKWNPPDEKIYDLFTPFSDRPLPNPRQLLEFGWDSNLNAVNNQFKKFFSSLFEGDLFPPLLLLLALTGGMALPRQRLGLLGLLGPVLLVYVLFINIFWHYEPRYFLVWIPWLALFGFYGLNRLYDKMAATGAGSLAREDRPRSKRAAWLLLAALIALLLPGLLALREDGPAFTQPTGIVQTANWLKQNTPSNAVIMSRNVWELSFHSERKSVMIPNNASLEQIKAIMQDYGARYLQLDHLNDREINRQWGQRRDLWPLLDKAPETDKKYAGFRLVYDKGGLLVYEWNGR